MARPLVVHADWDPEAGVWVATTQDIRGLVTEAVSIEALRAKGAASENVGDRVSIPTFGEHRNGNNTADLFTEPALAPNRVHHLA